MQELLAKISKKIQNCSCFHKGGIFGPESPDCSKVKIPFFRMVFGPFSLLLDNPRAFFTIGSAYAFVISLIAFGTGFGYLCLYSSSGEVAGYCSNSGPIYLLYFLLKLLIIAAFAVKWCEYALHKKILSWKQLFSPSWRILKLSLLLLLLLLLNCTPFLSSYILYIREPNPDWRVEIAFFAVVSIGFLVPFVVLRFYSLVAFVIYGQPLPNLKEMWHKNSGNNLNLLGGLFVILIFAAIIFSSLYRNFGIVAHDDSYYIAFVSEFIYNLTYLFFATLLINHCCVQQLFLYGEPDDRNCPKQ